MGASLAKVLTSPNPLSSIFSTRFSPSEILGRLLPKVDESIKALYVSMDESKKRTVMLRAKREFLEIVFSTDCFHKKDEDRIVTVFLVVILCLVRFKLMIKGQKKSQL